jgi:integrase
MIQDKLAHNEVIKLADALWKLLRSEYPADFQGFEGVHTRELGRNAPADGPQDRWGWVAQREARKTFLSRVRADFVAPNSQMTIASFVENKFLPEYIALKRPSGRAYYKAMLRHVLRPEEVDGMLSVARKKPRRKLKAVPGWPYLSNVRLCDARPEHISRLISAALDRGYSVNTVAHIRNVVSAIFSHAKREQCFLGENPVSVVRPPEARRKRTQLLSLTQAKKALSVMEYPERELTLLSIFTGMNLAEILGLQWKQVNLTEEEFNRDGKPAAPRTIAVRNQLYRGSLENVKKSRVRDLPIPQPLFEILVKLKGRASFTGPDDFVLVSKVGTPVNQNNILARRIRPIAKQLGVPSLSCPAFLGIRKVLASEFGKPFRNFTMIAVASDPERSAGVEQRWHCRIQRARSYSGDKFALASKAN